MQWQVQVLKPEFEKRFLKHKPCPPSAWEDKQVVVTRSYVRAHEKAQAKNPGRIVHTFILE